MAATPNMGLVKPIVSSTVGPLWATMLNAEFDLIDAHDHTSGRGARVPTAGLNINAALAFASNDATALRSTRFTSQSAVFSLAADVGCVYMKSGELYFRDLTGANVQITSGGVLNAAALNANTFPQQDVSADYNILSTNANTHFSVDASAASRIVTLPKAADVSAGRFYIVSDRLGSCIASGTPRTITIQREATTTDTVDGAASTVIDLAYGAVMLARTSASTWKVIGRDVLATSTRFGLVKLTQDFGGTADAPTVVAMTGAANIGTLRMPLLRFANTVATPSIGQSILTGSAGQSLTIRPQGGDGASNNGGDLLLACAAGGSGTAGGRIAALDGTNAEIASFEPSATPGAGYFKVSGSGSILFAKGLDSSIGHEARTTSGAGHSIGITAQSGLTSGLGGSIQMNAGNGAGAAGGSISMLAGAASGSGSNGGSLSLVSGASAGTGLPGLVSLSVDSFNAVTAMAVAASRRVVAIAGIPNATKLPANTGDGVMWFERATVDPSSSPGSLPTQGFTLCSNATDYPFFANGNGTLAFSLGTTITASAGAIASPGNFAGYIQVLVNGAVKNIPYFN